MCSLEEGEEIFNITIRKLTLEKAMKYFLIGGIAKRYLVMVIA